MTKVYFGFAIADSMLPDECDIMKSSLNVEEAKAAIAGAVPCINKSHKATIDAMKERFGIEVEIPNDPPSVSLDFEDVLIVMSVRGLPRLTGGHYSEKEISEATFKFSYYKVKCLM
jgi:hypothetical protein